MGLLLRDEGDLLLLKLGGWVQVQELERQLEQAAAADQDAQHRVASLSAALSTARQELEDRQASTSSVFSLA